MASLAQPEKLTAVLTQLQGMVTISEAALRSRGPDIPPRRVQFLQIVGMGDEIHVPAGAGVGFVCSTDRWVELPENQGQRLTEQLCRNGKRLPPGTYRRLAPVAGRMVTLKGAVNVLEGETRVPWDEAYGVPHLLSPRSSSVLDGRPRILWTQVQEAIEYEITLTGPAPFNLRLDAEQVSCEERWGDITICSLLWPEKEKELPPETISFLSIGARLSLAGPLREESESRVQRLSTEKTEEIRSQLESLNALPLDDATRLLLEADLYAREGLLADAIPAYRKALALQALPEIRMTLGDAYLKTGLLRFAALTYKEALDGNPSPVVQAAAELGLGRVEYDRQSFERAACHFRKARDLYLSLGLKEEAALAKRAAREAEKKKRPG
jgi:hypothetical protein